jgi:hypothetical protein
MDRDDRAVRADVDEQQAVPDVEAGHDLLERDVRDTGRGALVLAQDPELGQIGGCQTEAIGLGGQMVEREPEGGRASGGRRPASTSPRIASVAVSAIRASGIFESISSSH